MKLMCISEGVKGKTRDTLGNTGVYVPPVFVGSEYTITDVVYDQGKTYYELGEVPPTSTRRYLYVSTMFANLSDLDETELVNHKPEPATC